MGAKKIRPKMRCSAFDCNNVEDHVGQFKTCAGCEIKYYCSQKCHEQHWEDGHQIECSKKSKKSTKPKKQKKKKQNEKKCGSPPCENVENSKSFKSCGKCLQLFYCSRDCQISHWHNGHKRECKKL